MAIVYREFTKYTLYYISGSSPTIGMPHEAEIDCFDNNENRAGAIYFLPDKARLPSNVDTVNGIYLYFKLSRFSDVISLLREEKPLYLSFDTVKKYGYIGTNYELIGEQEGV